MKDIAIVKAGEGLKFIDSYPLCICALDVGKKAVVESDPDELIVTKILGKAIVDDEFDTADWKIKQVLR